MISIAKIIMCKRNKIPKMPIVNQDQALIQRKTEFQSPKALRKPRFKRLKPLGIKLR